MPKSTEVRSHGNNVRDIIIAHVISADTQLIYRRGNGKVILGPAGRALCARPSGKYSAIDCGNKLFPGDLPMAGSSRAQALPVMHNAYPAVVQ